MSSMWYHNGIMFNIYRTTFIYWSVICSQFKSTEHHFSRAPAARLSGTK